MKNWALREVWDWLGYKLNRPGFDALASDIAMREPEVYIIDIVGGVVSVRNLPNSEINKNYPGGGIRVEIYRSWIQRVLKTRNLESDISLLMSVGDRALNNDYIPVFAFQKNINNKKAILLPDVDLLASDFSFPIDNVPFDQKINKATFSGSTTGGHINLKSIESKSIPRIEAFRYFRGSNDVYFNLPNIVQCGDDYSRHILRSMGIGDGIKTSWSEAFKSKFIYSMDGNGATCSRVYAAMQSNSVLIKYKSDDILYYFSHMIPYEHFIPAEEFSSVESIVKLGESYPDLFDNISVRSREFCFKYLNSGAAEDYTFEVLKMYSRIFN